MKFMIKNLETGKTLTAHSYALNPAARKLGLKTPLEAPWMGWELWNGNECLWHATSDGHLHVGARAA